MIEKKEDVKIKAVDEVAHQNLSDIQRLGLTFMGPSKPRLGLSFIQLNWEA